MIDLEKLSHEEKEALAEDCEDFLQKLDVVCIGDIQHP